MLKNTAAERITQHENHKIINYHMHDVHNYHENLYKLVQVNKNGEWKMEVILTVGSVKKIVNSCHPDLD